MRKLAGKKILLGITGGIAAYKSAILCRQLKRLEADVRVIMTAAATQVGNQIAGHLDSTVGVS